MKHRIAGAPPLDFATMRTELEVPGDFASDALAEATRAAAVPPGAAGGDGYDDATDIPFVTVDPPGSRDLDQALHLARAGDGYLVSYAIADVASFVTPGGALDAETHRRGETLYFPDLRVPLHPPVLSEGAASLLPGETRPAALWQITLAADGEVTATTVRRARVRSTAQLDYPGVQAALDAHTLPGPIALLADVGRLRQALARTRHAIELDVPEQLVERDGDGWRVALRADLPVEAYNAEISLLTGMCAATIMLAGGVGLLRTVPPADVRTIAALRRAAHALGVPWPDGTPPGDILVTLDRGNPKHVALIEHAASLLRGAAYTPFDGAPPAQALHAGIGAPYAHVTAPLRRLADRYATEVCLALHANAPVPDWARSALPVLPGEMARADRLAHTVDRAVVDATEAWLLQGRVGETFGATVVDADEKAATIVLDEPAVRARCEGHALPVGEHVRATLVTADVAAREVRFRA